ncbi:hypothetical protein D3C75_855220 [compost metagenome]
MIQLDVAVKHLIEPPLTLFGNRLQALVPALCVELPEHARPEAGRPPARSLKHIFAVLAGMGKPGADSPAVAFGLLQRFAPSLIYPRLLYRHIHIRTPAFILNLRASFIETEETEK